MMRNTSTDTAFLPAAWRPCLTLVTLCGLIGLSGCGGEQRSGPDYLVAELPHGATMAFVPVPAGSFRMGSPVTEAARDQDEGPVHDVRFARGFHLGRTEVTQGQWEAVMGTQPWKGKPFVVAGPEYPAVYVSWFDAEEMAARLNALAGEELYRLPTEAEWEYACRAGTQTRWSFGDDPRALDEYAWHTGNAWDAGLQHAQPVAALDPNRWGLFDMHGNVSEWVADWYDPDYYSGSPAQDPAGPDAGEAKVYRGGYFHNDGARRLRSANRMFFGPDAAAAAVGFRLLRQQR